MHEIGRALLTELSHDIEVTGRKSLLWRVIAKNDEESRKELQQTLTAAQVCANTILDVAGAGWAAFVAGTAHLKSYLALYRKLEAAQKEAAPPTASARILRDSGVDRFVTTAGAYLLNRFPMKGIQDTAGNAMVRFVLLTRALMERDEAISLVAEELSSGQQGKRYFLGLRAPRSGAASRRAGDAQALAGCGGKQSQCCPAELTDRRSGNGELHPSGHEGGQADA
ncbi:hypothetical protein G6F66_013932 [Rhizopus arrhizus]|nr:hypothetical protein G6F66_013932 [Rhizopus arrhizus]